MRLFSNYIELKIQQYTEEGNDAGSEWEAKAWSTKNDMEEYAKARTTKNEMEESGGRECGESWVED